MRFSHLFIYNVSLDDDKPFSTYRALLSICRRKGLNVDGENVKTTCADEFLQLCLAQVVVKGRGLTVREREKFKIEKKYHTFLDVNSYR